jgi:hypothetical protein
MSKPRHLSWENFHSTIWKADQQRTHRVGRAPIVEIFADGVSKKIGLWIQLDGVQKMPQEVDRLSFIQGRFIKKGDRHFLVITTDQQGLFRQFYQFATSVADRILLEKSKPTEAVVSELKCFDELLTTRTVLSIEKQIGLVGELLVLLKLIGSVGSSALSAWIGPKGEQHDFRVGKLELEVKTSCGTRRVHRIHGLDQMYPTRGFELNLVSVMIEPAGKGPGFSLASLVDDVINAIGSDTTMRDLFEKNLHKLGWRSQDQKYYGRDWLLRRPLLAVRVRPGFPRLGHDDLKCVLGAKAHRVEYVEYIVNLEGLGIEDGNKRFPKLIAKQPRA